MAEQMYYLRGPDGEKYYTVGQADTEWALEQGYNFDEEQPNYAKGIPVYSGGVVKEMSPEDARRTVLKEAGRLTSSKELAAQREREIFDSPVLAFISGAARGATFGLSDRFAGPGWAEDASRLQQANPIASGAGEMAGGLGTVLATGGGAGLGRMAASGAARLGAAEGGLLARTVGGTVTGLAEGAAFNVGKEISDAALAGREVDSAKIIQALGNGALAGGAVGGALPLGGGLLSGAGKGVMSIGRSAMEKAAEKLAQSEAGLTIQNAIQKKTLQALGATDDMIERISQGGLSRQADDILAREVPATLGKAEGSLLARTEMKEALANIQVNTERRLASALEQVDIVSGGVGPNISKIVQRAEQEVFAPMETSFLGSAGLKEARSTLSDIAALKDYKVSYSGISQIGEELGQMGARATSPERAKALLGIQKIINEELGASAASFSERLGVDLSTEIPTLSQKLSAARILTEAVEEGVKAEARGAGLFSTVEAAISGAKQGATAGGAAGAYLGGPLGGALGSAVGGILGAASNVATNRLKALYGDQMVSTAARAFAEGSPARLAAMVDGVVGNAAGQYLKKAVAAAEQTVRPAKVVATKGAADLLDSQVRKALFGDTPEPRSKTSAPIPVAQRVKNAVQGKEKGGASAVQVKTLVDNISYASEQQTRALEQAISTAPPDVAAVLKGQLNASTATTQYLLSLIPTSSNQMNSLTPQTEAPQMSKAEVDRLVTAVRVAVDPLSVIDSMEKGALTRTEVEALQSTAPAVYQQLVTSVQVQLSSLEAPLPYKEALQLSTLLGVAGDPSLEPANMSWLQQAYTTSVEPPQQPMQRDAPTRGKIELSRDWAVYKEEP